MQNHFSTSTPTLKIRCIFYARNYWIFEYAQNLFIQYTFRTLLISLLTVYV